MAKSKSIICEKEGDLFRASRNISLAHCVSSDMKMGAGIAVYFRKKFGQVDKLLKQRKSVGQVAYLKEGTRFIFYLVTKKWFYDKPTELTLHHSLLEMRSKCKKLGVTRLAMPRIGCGLDGLKWPLVFKIVQEVFSDCGMEVTIYSLPEKFKTFTPTLSKTQESLRNYFETQRGHSVPASKKFSSLNREAAPDSVKSRLDWDVRCRTATMCLDRECDEVGTPKKRKKAKNNQDSREESDIVKETSNTSKRSDMSTEESSSTPSPQKPKSPPIKSRHNLKFSHPLPSTVQAEDIPFISDEDTNVSRKVKYSDSEIESGTTSDSSTASSTKQEKCLSDIKKKPVARDVDEDLTKAKLSRRQFCKSHHLVPKDGRTKQKSSVNLTTEGLPDRLKGRPGRVVKSSVDSDDSEGESGKARGRACVSRTIPGEYDEVRTPKKRKKAKNNEDSGEESDIVKETSNTSKRSDMSTEENSSTPSPQKPKSPPIKSRHNSKLSHLLPTSDQTEDIPFISVEDTNVSKSRSGRIHSPNHKKTRLDIRVSPSSPSPLKHDKKKSSVYSQTKGLSDRWKDRLGGVVDSDDSEGESGKASSRAYLSRTIPKRPTGTMYADKEGPSRSVKSRLH